MKRRYAPESNKGSKCTSWTILVAVTSVSFIIAYALFSPLFASKPTTPDSSQVVKDSADSDSCCRGVEHLEFWGRVVQWGDKFHSNSTHACCSACRARCPEDGACECNSWVYCGDREKCGDRFGQCWLKNQHDPLAPDIQASGNHVMWTSGLMFGKDTGIMGITTTHGTIRMKALVDCAPYSVAYLLELQKMRHCAGCHIYRAEGRGSSWDNEGHQVGQTKTGPYALLQGTLAVQTVAFKELPKEACPVVRRGSVGWIGGGPDFFISLADHNEWYPKHTVFAHVLKEDMHIVEKIAALPTVPSVWEGVRVAVLENSLPFKLVSAGPPQAAQVAAG